MALTAAQKAAAQEEALRFVRSLGDALVDSLTPEEIADIVEQELGKATIAARVIAIDKALKLVDAVEKAVREGVIPEAWDNRQAPQSLISVGLGKYDPRVAFQAGMRAAYGVGRYERAMASGMPLLVYRSMRDSRVREAHRRLNGVTLPKNDSFWGTHYPPNGWRCRCKVFAVNESGVARLEAAGVPVQREAPDERMVEYRNKATGEVQRLPESIEPGWDYNPRNEPQRLAEMLAKRMKLLREGPAQ